MTGFQVVVDLDEAYTKQRVIASLSKIPDCTILSVHESFDTNIPVLYWQEYERIPWDLVIKSRDNAMVCANSFCIRKALIRKAQQSYMIQKFVAKRPESILKTSYPETFIVELDHPDYFDEFLNEIYEVEADLRDNEAKEDADKTLFIMKASLTNRGSGIFLFNSVEQLEDIITRIYDETSESDDSCLSLVREWIIQRYIGNPLLVIGGKKFHLRAYV